MAEPELGQMLFGNKWESVDAPAFMASDLYELSRMLGQRDPEAQSHGVFGGEWGYGQDFTNDTFSMFPYWWGDCTCGRDQAESEWDRAHPAASDAECVAWCEANQHDPACPVVRPNFVHAPTGIAVHWYKYIGRSMTCNRDVEWSEWREVVADCARSVGDRSTPHDG